MALEKEVEHNGSVSNIWSVTKVIPDFVREDCTIILTGYRDLEDYENKCRGVDLVLHAINTAEDNLMVAKGVEEPLTAYSDFFGEEVLRGEGVTLRSQAYAFILTDPRFHGALEIGE